ncbi:hypothetical protein MRX96_023944 [Rhipicephalus microplus]
MVSASFGPRQREAGVRSYIALNGHVYNGARSVDEAQTRNNLCTPRGLPSEQQRRQSNDHDQDPDPACLVGSFRRLLYCCETTVHPSVRLPVPLRILRCLLPPLLLRALKWRPRDRSVHLR